MAADVTAIAYFAPIAAFLLVFIVSFAVLFKTNIIGENKWVQLFVSLLLASIFISVAGTRQYVLTIVPWFAVLLVSLFLILILTGLTGKDAVFMHKGIGVVVVVLFGIIFLVSGFFVFSDVVLKYIPGPAYGVGADESSLYLANTLYSPRVFGAILLVIVSAIVTWVLVKAKG